MMRKLIPVLLLTLVPMLLLAWTAQLIAYPEPSLIPKSWELEFKPQVPRAIAVRDLDGQTRWYWYLPYMVTNTTGEDQLFVPEFVVLTDQGDLVRAGRNVPAKVYEAIDRKMGNPLLENPTRATGRLLQGKDHARESVAIWPAGEGNVDVLTIFVGGLSGETAVVKNPTGGEDVLVQKSLMLTYELPGNPATPQDQVVTPKAKEWIMR